MYENARYNDIGAIQADKSGDKVTFLPGSRPFEEAQALEAAGEITIAPYVPPAPPTSAELDALADLVAAQMLDQDIRMKALGLVMADLIEKAFGVTQATARDQVKTRFRNYYRGLIG